MSSLFEPRRQSFGLNVLVRKGLGSRKLSFKGNPHQCLMQIGVDTPRGSDNRASVWRWYTDALVPCPMAGGHAATVAADAQDGVGVRRSVKQRPGASGFVRSTPPHTIPVMGTRTIADDLPQVTLFTDGACIGNPGPGGWGFILRHPASGRSKEGSGGEHGTTNNRMEIMAVIQGLEALKGPSRVELFSDSQYVVNAIHEWMPRWKQFGWKKSRKSLKEIKNADLWRRLDGLLVRHKVVPNWVRGHDGHIENERCDVLASSAADRIAATPPPPAVEETPSAGTLFAATESEDDEADE